MKKIHYIAEVENLNGVPCEGCTEFEVQSVEIGRHEIFLN